MQSMVCAVDTNFPSMYSLVNVSASRRATVTSSMAPAAGKGLIQFIGHGGACLCCTCSRYWLSDGVWCSFSNFVHDATAVCQRWRAFAGTQHTKPSPSRPLAVLSCDCRPRRLAELRDQLPALHREAAVCQRWRAFAGTQHTKPSPSRPLAVLSCDCRPREHASSSAHSRQVG
jgi:hypothetical protein